MHNELTYRKNSYAESFCLAVLSYVAFENYPEDTVLEPV